MNYSTSHNPAFVLKPRNDFALTILILVLIMMITLIPATMSNANASNLYDPNVYPCGGEGGLLCSYDLNVNGTHYAIKYFLMFSPYHTQVNSNGIVLNEITVVSSNKSIVLNVTVASHDPAYMMFILPRSLIDATNTTSNQMPFAVFDNGRPLHYCIGFSPGCHTRHDL